MANENEIRFGLHRGQFFAFYKQKNCRWFLNGKEFGFGDLREEDCERIMGALTLDGTQYFNYFMNGAKVQDAFPNLTPEQRDHITMGIHPECSAEMFKEEES